MKWKRGGSTPDVIDQRGRRGGRGGGLQIPIGRAGGGLGLAGVVIVLAIQLWAAGAPVASRSPPLDGVGPVSGEAPIPVSQDPDRDLAGQPVAAVRSGS
jgi:hypothetical protein